MDKARKICRGVFWTATVAWMLGSSTGCTRMFYRKQADCEVSAVLREKDIFPEWKIENMQVYPDPRARFADPTKPDRPPMPPDDPAAKFLGPNPQKPRHAGEGRMEGTGYLDLLATWDTQNRDERAARTRTETATNMTESIRNVAHWQRDGDNPDAIPAPRPFDGMPTVKTNPYLLRVDQAMELALINSREFQTRREDLYLSALPVTRERFAFAAQWLAVSQYAREKTGASLPGATGGNGWRAPSAVGVSKLFTTGALLLAAFANETALNFGNPTQPRVTSTSALNLDIIQPLLRGGGKAVTLEPLTLVERNLLYEIRNYARFRKQYYQFLIGGATLPNPPGSVTTAGSLASSHPLLGTAAGGNFARQQVVPAGLGSVGGSAVPGTLFLGVNTIAPAEGFLPTLFKDAVLRYEIANVKNLEAVLEVFYSLDEGGQVSSLQVDQVKLQLLQGRSSFLNRELERNGALDNFKIQLGLPLDISLELDDLPTRPITNHMAFYDKVLSDFKTAKNEVDGLYPAMPPEKMRATLDTILTNSGLTKSAVKFRSLVSQSLKTWRALDDKAIIQRLSEKREERRKLLDAKASSLNEGKASTQNETVKLRENATETAVGELEQALREYEKKAWLKEKTPAGQRQVQSNRWMKVRDPLVLILEDASTERFADLRSQWPELPAVLVEGVDVVAADSEKSYEIVTRFALDNRLDLMNSRAQVVDSWRQLRVFANGLLGVFNLAYHMDSSTPPGAATPLAFQNSRTRHQLIMNFDMPLVRITERNAYRASLIAYQRSRRDLDQKEDEITAQVRADIRQLQVLEKNFKIQRDAVELAYRQVDNSWETFRAPEVPNNNVADAAARAAALTNQLLNAYRGLPLAQQQLLKTWIDYQIARQQLFLDLELMPLDARGVWIDELNYQPSVRQSGQLEREPVEYAPNLREGDYRSARESRGGFRNKGLYLVALLLVLVLSTGGFAYYLKTAFFREPYTGPTFTVKKELLRVTIVERGSLESAENSDIVCRVKAKSQGSTIASTIKWVIEDGAQVKLGDLVIELDDSGFQEQLKTQRNTNNKYYFEWVEAKTKSVIAESQNESDIKTAEVLLNLAELDLKKYVGDLPGVKIVKIGSREQLQKYLSTSFDSEVRKELATDPNKLTSEYLQELNDIEGRIEIARSDKETWLDRAAWSQRMVKKGYYSLSQADADQSRLASAEISLRKVQGELDIYRKFKLERQLTKLWSDLKEGERALIRVKKQAESKMEQARADETAKKAILDQEISRLRDMEKEEKYYRITAPQDGMIVYYIPEQARFGGGSQQATIAQGEPVREGQKLIRIPNLHKMLVNARVHEAMVSKVKADVTKPTGYSDRLRYTFSMGRLDLFGIAAYQTAFEELDETFKEKDSYLASEGHQAKIRVEAFPGKQYSGRVKSVATVASQADFMASDIKLYQTMVSLDDLKHEKLKPGMSAEVTILADESPVEVLVIPIQAVVGNVSMGATRKCYVLDQGGFAQEREIVVGMSNDKYVEVKAGISEGEVVALNPKVLLPEKSDMKPGSPGTRRGAEFEEGGEKKGRGKKTDGGKINSLPVQGDDGKAIQQRSEVAPLPPQDRGMGTNKKS